jgi:hypothetical protein
VIRKSAELGVRVYALNGWIDHIHLVASIPPRISIADVVKGLKGASSHYINHEIRLPDHFAWQRGYGVFTLGETQRAAAEAYVERQKEHHTRQTVNSWLERTDELDEGPPDNGLTSWSDGLHHLREEQAIYVTADPFPF